MLVWGALAIPLVTAVVLYVWFKHKVVIWEFLIPIGVSLVLITASSFIVEYSQTRDDEYWGGLVVTAEHYEDWNERVPCTHSYEVCSGTGEYETCTTQYRHAYDVDYHPEYWKLTDTNGISTRTSQSTYRRLVRKFGNRTFVDLGRHYHTNDGDKYVTRWPKTRETAEPMVSKHTYENRVKASRSVFNYQEVSVADQTRYELYEYPALNGHRANPILGDGGSSTLKARNRLLFVNGKLGPRKQVFIWVLVFKNQPRDAGHLQEALWVGSNKNEFVVTVGVDSAYRVEWSHVFSWTKQDRLKIDARHFVEEQDTLDLVALVDWLEVNVAKQYQRREFSEFEYLKVEPPFWAVLLIYLLTLAANIGVSYYVVHNEYEEPRYGR